MIRLSKLTDYGFVVLTLFARREANTTVLNARDVAAETSLPMPTVSKLLKILAKNGLLVATRGINGGYKLTRRPVEISVAEILSALEGPVAMTDCLSDHDNDCIIEGSCPCRGHWHLINAAVSQALEGITLAQMANPATDLQARQQPAQVAAKDFFSERGACACPSNGAHRENGSAPCSCSSEKEHHQHPIEVENAKQ